MSINQKQEFDDIVADIINHPVFQELDSEMHHGISRYGHSYRVGVNILL